MKPIRKLIVSALVTCAIIAAWPLSVAWSGDAVELSCSAQVYSAFAKDDLAAFTQTTGIGVNIFVGSSPSALNRLMNEVCDIAVTVGNLARRHSEYGYVERPFCIDPIAVITHPRVGVSSLTEVQLQGIFTGDITNWKTVGGPDQAIMVVMPGKSTGAYHNFRQLALKRSEIRYDLMAYQSTMVIATVENVPWSISFISMGAAAGGNVSTVAIDGIAPGQANYPYTQTFNFVTRGLPKGAVKALIDFTFSDAGAGIIKSKNMTPLQP